LASALGVSNNPVIQSLRRLEGLGILEHTPSGKTRVRECTDRDLYAAYAVREAIESVAARFCAALASDEELAVLNVRHAKMEDRYRRGEWAEREEQDFHRGVVAFAHTPFLEHLHKSAMVIRTTFRQHLIQGRRIRDMGGLHKPIMEALERRNAEAAEEAMRAHIRQARESFAERQFGPGGICRLEHSLRDDVRL
jgi:DNA-binding GntR family transcriptional regulator